MTHEPHEPTREDLLAVSSFSRTFLEPDFVVGQWSTPAHEEDGVLVLGFWVPSDEVEKWHEALYEHHIIDLDSGYLSAEWAKQMRRNEEDPSGLASADLATIRRALTTISRANRFCEGYMERMFERGIVQAAMRRLEDFAG